VHYNLCCKSSSLLTIDLNEIKRLFFFGFIIFRFRLDQIFLQRSKRQSVQIQRISYDDSTCQRSSNKQTIKSQLFPSYFRWINLLKEQLTIPENFAISSGLTSLKVSTKSDINGLFLTNWKQGTDQREQQQNTVF
jgi:hypothetical protein